MSLPWISRRRESPVKQINAHATLSRATQKALPTLTKSSSPSKQETEHSSSSLRVHCHGLSERSLPEITHYSESFSSFVRIGSIAEPFLVGDLISKLKNSTRNPFELARNFPESMVVQILREVGKIFHQESNVLDITITDKRNLTIVGDIHGQFYDLMQIFESQGYPSENKPYLFLGDYVDRGYWGMEVVLLLFLFKIQNPSNVLILRGNHETRQCTEVYGFQDEVELKYSSAIYDQLMSVFDELPLACLIESSGTVQGKGSDPTSHTKSSRKTAMALHGGLFRKRFSQKLGSIFDLDSCIRFGEPSQQIIEDVLWSDPSDTQGLSLNMRRNRGLQFGAQATQQFLKENSISLLIRAHENPKSRASKKGLNKMHKGFAVDHDGQHGAVVTLFSAPNYPQGSDHDSPAAFMTLDAKLSPMFHNISPSVERVAAETALKKQMSAILSPSRVNTETSN